MWKTSLLLDASSSVGVNPLSSEDVILDLYPNPNNGVFTLTINGYDNSNLRLEVINVMGKIVSSEEITITNKHFQSEFGYDLANGIYFLKISNGNRMRSIRFIVE